MDPANKLSEEELADLINQSQCGTSATNFITDTRNSLEEDIKTADTYMQENIANTNENLEVDTSETQQTE